MTQETAQLPAPLTPIDCDLRGAKYMPLFADRLLGSETWKTGTDRGKVAALQLWCRAFCHEVPAGSLPDSEELIADYAGVTDLRTWKKIRDHVMRGWVKCSDGRLYHARLAEAVEIAWESRQKGRQKNQKAAERVKRWRQNKKKFSELSLPAASTPDADPATVIFKAGLKWLQQSTGKSEDACRGLLGRWRKAVGDLALITVLGVAQRQGPIDAVAYIEGCLKEHKKTETSSMYVRKAGAPDWN
jgi:hypothetical protein